MRVTLFPTLRGGAVTVPPSKSMAHRGIICAALANGESRVQGLAYSEDITATLHAMQQLGAQITLEGDTALVHGVSRVDFCVPQTAVDCAESGSTLRLLLPIFSLIGQPVQFIGRGRLLQRPQEIYKELFLSNNLHFEHSADGITFCGPLTPGAYTLDGSVSSQFISGLTLALAQLCSDSTLSITPPFESRSYVQLTLQAMADFGHSGVRWAEENTLQICGGSFLPRAYTVEKDWSQAAFFAVLGAVRGNITLKGLRTDSAQGDRVILDILRRCGAIIAEDANGLHFTQSTLTATEIDLADCPDLGPILMVLALFCTGETVIYNAARLRMKESDRIAAMESEIAKMGGYITSDANTVRVRGSNLHASDALHGHNDHRIVMAMTIAALAAQLPASIDDAQAINKSYPNFFDDVTTLGAEVRYE